jgi:hypothetical protein
MSLWANVTQPKGRLCLVDLLVSLKSRNIFNIKSSWSALVSTRRWTVHCTDNCTVLSLGKGSLKQVVLQRVCWAWRPYLQLRSALSFQILLLVCLACSIEVTSAAGTTTGSRTTQKQDHESNAVHRTHSKFQHGSAGDCHHSPMGAYGWNFCMVARFKSSWVSMLK